MSNPQGICHPWQIVTVMELLEGNVDSFWASAATLGQVIVRLETDAQISPDTAGYIGTAMGDLARQATRLNLRSVSRQCQRVADYVHQGSSPITHARLREMLVDVLLRTGDDLEDQYFLAVPPEYIELYKQPEPPFGREVADTFPKVSEDISEAAQ